MIDQMILQGSFLAAGFAFDWFSTGSQRRLLEKGQELDHAGLDYKLSAIRAQSAEESLQSMIELRQTIGSQIAANAAMGRSSGVGSAFFIGANSIANQGKEERIRGFNLTSKELQVGADRIKGDLGVLGKKTEMTNKLLGRIFKDLPGPSAISEWANQNKEGFGLDSVGAGSLGWGGI